MTVLFATAPVSAPGDSPAPYPFALARAASLVRAARPDVRTRFLDARVLGLPAETFLEECRLHAPDWLVFAAEEAPPPGPPLLAALRASLPAARLWLAGGTAASDLDHTPLDCTPALLAALPPPASLPQPDRFPPWPYLDDRVAWRYRDPFPHLPPGVQAQVRATGLAPGELEAWLRDLGLRFQIRSAAFSDTPFDLTSIARVTAVGDVLRRLGLPWIANTGPELPTDPALFVALRDGACHGLRIRLSPELPGGPQSLAAFVKGLRAHDLLAEAELGQDPGTLRACGRLALGLPFSSVRLLPPGP